jgi:hypothetical protein
VDQINFVTRVTTPILMLNGRYDFVEPVETSQRPMFDLLATPAADKRHVIFETGHAVVTLQPMIKEVLEGWIGTWGRSRHGINRTVDRHRAQTTLLLNLRDRPCADWLVHAKTPIVFGRDQPSV